MASSDKATAIVLVVLIATLGGCLGNAIHQEEVTRQLRITHDCGKVTP